MRATILVHVAVAAGYSLNRAVPQTNGVPGFACIPVPMDRLVAPGQRATMHVYDPSSLQVLRHAQAHANSTYGQVVLDEAAMRERKFEVMAVGSRLKIVSLQPSTHQDKFGGSSQSLIAEVIGVGIIEPGQLFQKMPFMTVDCKGEDRLLTSDEGCAIALEALEETALLCQSLDSVASFKGPLTRQTESESGREWSIAECVSSVLEYRGYDKPTDAIMCAPVSALAATVHLPGEVRYEAMRLAQQAGTSADELVQYVQKALEEESRRRLAVKALADLGSGP